MGAIIRREADRPLAGVEVLADDDGRPVVIRYFFDRVDLKPEIVRRGPGTTHQGDQPRGAPAVEPARGALLTEPHDLRKYVMECHVPRESPRGATG